MTFTFTALLCLGLTLGLRTPGLAGSLPKPVLRVQPDSVVSTQTKVTFVCEGTTGAKEYRLYKKGYQYPMTTKIPHNPGNKAEFSFSNIGRQYAGHYKCQYKTYAKSSEYSEFLELVVTGAYWKPSLSAQPSPVVSTGGDATLQCVSGQQYKSFILTTEGPQKLFWRRDSQYNPSTGKYQALFSVGPVTPDKRWTFRCYSYEKSTPQVWSEPSDSLEILVSGNLQKSTIKAEPGSVIAFRSAMIIWCQDNQDTEIYVLHKEGSQKPWGTQTPEEPGKKAKFSISSVTQQHAGQYRCYSYSSAGWSERSDTLELVVTEIHYGKPTLSAMSSPVVSSGGNLTLQCISQTGYNKFTITKDNEKFSGSQNTLSIYRNWHYQAVFSIEHMTPNHTGTFRCYGYYKDTPHLWSVPSEPLEIFISGLSKKPSLLTHQGHILDPGMGLTLQCSSDINYDRFALYKVGDAELTQHYGQQTQAGCSLANFTLGYVSQSTGGQYRCYGAHNLSSEWSASSDPLDILITGQLPDTPTLSVKPNSTVHSGQNVSLLCWLKYQVDTFILSKEGSAHQPLHLKSKFQDGQFQAEFSMSAVTSTLAGTYRCYASQDSSLYLLSYASTPVELIVSGPIETSSLPPSSPLPRAGLETYLHALIGVSVAFLLFLFILIFLLVRRRRQGKFRKDAHKETELQLPSGAAGPVTRDRGSQKRSKPAAAIQEEGLYASVEDMGPEDGVEMNSQVAHSEEPQDVTYAQLCIRTLRQGRAVPPFSQAEEATEEPTVYAALAAAPPGVVPKDKDQ